MSTQLDRIEQMLRALCTHLGIQDLEKSGNGSGQSLGAEADGRYTGVVSRFEHGWGFIECEAMNRNFFVHYSDIEGAGLRSLDPGDAVSFEIAPGKDGRPKAVRVRRHASGQPVPKAPRIPAIPRSRYGYADHGMGDDDEDDPGAGDPVLTEPSAAGSQSGSGSE